MKNHRLLKNYFLFVLLSGWLLLGAAIRANAQEKIERLEFDRINTAEPRPTFTDPLLGGQFFNPIKLAREETTLKSNDFQINEVFTEPRTLTVTNTNDSGEGSLRWAITEANQSDFRDEIVFNIPGDGPHFIQPTSWLPDITKPVVVDGTSQPGYSVGSPKIAIDGSIVPPGDLGVNALWLKAGSSGSLIKGLVIINYPHVNFRNGGAIVVDSDNNVFEANFLGISPDGTMAAPNYNGIQLEGKNNVVGGDSHEKRNVISGNTGPGISIGIRTEGATGNIPEDNLVIGNFIGTDVTGFLAVSNQTNLSIGNGAINTMVGGLSGNLRNIISGATGVGIWIAVPNTVNTQIKGNFIGTNAAGSAALANNWGVFIVDGPANTIVGGEEEGAGNVISGNTQSGIMLSRTTPVYPVTGTIIKGNLIGLDQSGQIAIPNTRGIHAYTQAINSVIGGTNQAARNIISGNSLGIELTGVENHGNLIRGNYIGTNPEGQGTIPNIIGIIISGGANNNVVGGISPGESNVISGNSNTGVSITGAQTSNNYVQGNIFGLNAQGSSPVVPNNHGIVIQSGANNNLIGGPDLNARNIISGNNGVGIRLITQAQSNLIQNNFIGTDITGTQAFANFDGIELSASTLNQIGGTGPGERNLTSGNSRFGIVLFDEAFQNQIIGNIVGTTLNVTAKLGNNSDGILVRGNQNLISQNIISGNAHNGIQVQKTTDNIGDSNIIRDNYIGTNPDGQNLGNSRSGVYVFGASNNHIGGNGDTHGNVIAFNSWDGVRIATLNTFIPTGNRVLGNSISSNVLQGIDLGGNGITPNDAGDADTGPNKLQNFPEISQASFGGGQLEVTYFVPSAPANSAYPIRVEFFRTNTNERQGKTFLGFDEFTVADHTAGTKTASFDVAPELGFEIGNQITATATDADGNTSHFGTLVTSQPGQVFFTITSSAGSGGTIEPLGATEVIEGGSQLYTITPDTGFEVADVLVDGSSVGAVPSYLFEGVISNRTIHATFQKQTFTIAASAGVGGSIDPLGNVVVEYGDSQNFVIIADADYEIADVIVDGLSVGAVSSYLFENVTSNHTIVASFEMLPPDLYTLTLQANPMGAGTVSGGGSFEEGQLVPVSASANAGYDFVNWTRAGVEVSAEADFNYEMPAENVTLVANFEKQTFTIVASAGTGGSISPMGNVVVEYGDSQNFVIIADADYEIADVIVDGLSVGAVSTYLFENVTSNHTIVASFEMLPPDLYTLTLQANPMGAGTVSGGGSFEEGQLVPVSASANAGYDFVNWTLGGVIVSAEADFNYEMPAENVTLVANFEKQTFTIVASAGTGGSIDPLGSIVVEYGESQSFVITADAGYEIADVLVDGVSVGALPSYTFQNIMDDHTIEAQFDMLPPDLYTLTLQVNPMGAGTVSGGGSFEEGQLVPVSASANAGYDFVNWTRGGVEVSASADFSYEMSAENVTLVANFEKQTFTIVASAGAGGSINPVGNVVVEYGESQSFIIIADAGYEIADVLVDNVSIGGVSSYTFENVMTDHTIEAQFSMLPPDLYTLTLQVNPMGAGTVSGGGSFEEGQLVPVSASANAGYDFVNWTRSGAEVSAAADFSYEMPAENVTLVANFEKQTFTIVASAGTGGSINPVGNVVVEYGESQNFVIIADAGYEIADVIVDGLSVGAVSSYLFENVTSNHTIVASFEMLPPDLYTLTLQANPMGAGTVSGGGSFEEGQLVPVSASANAGYDFVNWTRGGVEVSAEADFNYEMPAENVTLVANFEKQTFTIVASAGTGGSISPMGDVVVEYGDSQSFAITPDAGYEIADVLVNGASVGAIATYTFQNVVADHTIEALFGILPVETYTLTLLAEPEEGGMVYGEGEYEAGAMINVSALANAGYQFVNWTRDGQVISGMSSFLFEMPAIDVTLVANFEEIMGIYCSFSQGYWFARPQTVWPYNVVVGGHTFTQAQGRQFWPSNTPTKRAFTQYATIFLSGVTLSAFPELEAAMQVIDDYFANVYPSPANRVVNSAAGFIGDWVDQNHCVDTQQGIAEFDMAGHAAQEVSHTGDIDAKAYPNPFRRETSIAFMVQENVYVTIEVFNMVGERISLLFEGNVAAFEQTMVTFKGNDLPNGFYFYRVTAGRNIHTGRLILAR